MTDFEIPDSRNAGIDCEGMPCRQFPGRRVFIIGGRHLGKGIISTSRLPQTEGPVERYCRMRPGTWEVVAPVNGSKADVRRSGGFDTRIVTARLESLIVVRRAGSPGYSY